jgi:hypothetical protein
MAAAVMGLAAWGAALGLERLVGTRGLFAQAVTGLVPVVLGVGLYGALARVLGVAEAREVWSAARDRLRGRR